MKEQCKQLSSSNSGHACCCMGPYPGHQYCPCLESKIAEEQKISLILVDLINKARIVTLLKMRK